MYLSTDEMRFCFDGSNIAEAKKLSFVEYTILYRTKEGCNAKKILMLSNISTATLSRRKRSIAQKMKAHTFEQALIILAKEGFFEEY